MTTKEKWVFYGRYLDFVTTQKKLTNPPRNYQEKTREYWLTQATGC